MTDITLPPVASYQPSIWQQKIFDFVLTPLGPKYPYASPDAFVDAVAGSGKTSTFEQICKRLPVWARRQTIVCSFGREIARELGKRMPPEITSGTINSLTYKALARFVQPFERWTANDKKYRELVALWWESRVNMPYGMMDDELKAEIKAIASLISKMFVTLTNYRDIDQMARLAARFELTAEIPHFESAIECIAQVLEWGWKGLPSPVNGKTYSIREQFQFDEQVYYCATKDVRPYTYNSFVMVDEAQDLSPAQLKFVLKLRGRGCRFIFVGDKRQAIFAFAGADADSFASIQTITNAVEFQLPVCYRCPVTVLDRAREIVPHIQSAPNAGTGVTAYIKEEEIVIWMERLQASAKRIGMNGPVMMLCRCCAPLVSQCYALLAQGKRARIRGRKIGDELQDMLANIEKMDVYRFDRFVESAREWEARQLNNLRQMPEENEMQIANLCDKVESLLAIHSYVTGLRQVNNSSELRAAICDLFDDNGEVDVVLSTIHTAKGLEAAVVMIIQPELMPHPKAATEEAITQEMNLKYVAITRARYALIDIETSQK